jgi:DNA-binding HxlR family transcriptional regulator
VREGAAFAGNSLPVDTAPPPVFTTRLPAECPAHRGIEALGDKWKLLIVIALGQNGRMRFGALHAALPGINQKVLTSALRGLERDRIVERTAYTELPPRVEYELSERGRGALVVVQALDDWALRFGL